MEGREGARAGEAAATSRESRPQAACSPTSRVLGDRPGNLHRRAGDDNQSPKKHRWVSYDSEVLTQADSSCPGVKELGESFRNRETRRPSGSTGPPHRAEEGASERTSCRAKWLSPRRTARDKPPDLPVRRRDWSAKRLEVKGELISGLLARAKPNRHRGSVPKRSRPTQHRRPRSLDESSCLVTLGEFDCSEDGR